MNLTKWRDNEKLSQAAAGERLGLSQSTISRIEAGEQWPDPETLAKIIEGTEGRVTADDLLRPFRSSDGGASQTEASAA